MRIVLVGPTAPLFKGGIVHYTASLAQALSLKHQVKLLSFARGYPQRFFPGAAVSDQSQSIGSLPQADPILDWANPLSYWIMFKAIRQYRAEILVWQWWTWFWVLPSLIILLLIKLLTGTKIVIIAHNPFDHETALYKQWFSTLILSLADRILVPNQVLVNWLKKRFTNKEIRLALHPIYNFFAALPRLKNPVKLNKPYVLFFGHVRFYKGLDILIKAMVELWQSGNQVPLLIAGEFWESEQQYRRLIPPQYQKQVQIINRYTLNEEVDSLFRQCLLVAIPYRAGSGSGPSKIALSYGKPIVASDVGDNPDLFKIGSVGQLVPPDDIEALANAISQVAERTARYNKGIKAVQAKLTWTSLVAQITNK